MVAALFTSGGALPFALMLVYPQPPNAPEGGNMPERHRKKRVTLEETKLRQTTHWDLDYLPRDEVEALYDRDTAQPLETRAVRSVRKSMTPRQVGLICIAAGLGLLALAVVAARFFTG